MYEEINTTRINSNFAITIDSDGRIIDNINNTIIGINNAKKNEIIADLNSVLEENDSLKNKLAEYEKILVENGLIKLPPTVESLEKDVSNLTNLLSQSMTENQELKQMLQQFLKKGVATDEHTGDGKQTRSNRKTVTDGTEPT